MTVSFTPGSCSLTTYKVTEEGLKFGKANRNVVGGISNAQGYSAAAFEKVQMLLSNRFLGSFLVPSSSLSWNMNFVVRSIDANAPGEKPFCLLVVAYTVLMSYITSSFATLASLVARRA